MSFLDKLWDETLAGPTPETGLSKLRKYNSFKAITRSTPMVERDEVPVSRSITIARTQSSLTPSFSSDHPYSFPDYPSGSATPRTPLTPKTPGGDVKKLTRTKSSAEAQSLNIHHWMVINGSLDR